jgi:hypothetical protein
MITISVKILGHKRSLRYPVERSIIAAQRELPDVTLVVEHIRTVEEIQRYTPVFALPSLVINGKLVCVGRFPGKVEVLSWLQEVENTQI